MTTLRISDVAPIAKTPFGLRVTWADGTQDSVDLTGLIHRSRHFRRFVDDPAAFRKASVVEFGSGIEWPNGLDYGADTLRAIADEQRPLQGKDLAEFARAFDLDTNEVAALLEIAPRTVRAHRRAKTKKLPQTLAVTIRTMRNNDTVFAAHYKPVKAKPRGRPRKVVVG